MPKGFQGFQKGNQLGCLNKGHIAWNKGRKESWVLLKCIVCNKKFYSLKWHILHRKVGNGKFCSKKCKGIWMSKNLKKENSPAWKGGISGKNRCIRYSKRMNDWRKKVFKRDNYTCRECEARNGNGKDVYLEAHHIKTFSKFPKLRFIISNGITLCEDCHDNITFLYRYPNS